jgi:hypothetical protein
VITFKQATEKNISKPKEIKAIASKTYAADTSSYVDTNITRKDVMTPDNFMGENKQQDASVIDSGLNDELEEVNNEEDRQFSEMVHSIPEINKDHEEDGRKTTDVQDQSN